VILQLLFVGNTILLHLVYVKLAAILQQ